MPLPLGVVPWSHSSVRALRPLGEAQETDGCPKAEANGRRGMQCDSAPGRQGAGFREERKEPEEEEGRGGGEKGRGGKGRGGEGERRREGRGGEGRGR